MDEPEVGVVGEARFRVIGQARDVRRQLLAMKQVVLVKERNDLATRRVDSGRAGEVGTRLVGVPDVREPWILEPSDDLAGMVP